MTIQLKMKVASQTFDLLIIRVPHLVKKNLDFR